MPCGKIEKAAFIITTGEPVPACEKSSVGPIAAFGEPLETAEASPKMACGS
ncbi:MAG TPA: hypothetical protein VF571_15445 [Pyrinomonadaceae bacterium]